MDVVSVSVFHRAFPSSKALETRDLRDLLIEPLGRDGFLQLGDLARQVLDAMPEEPTGTTRADAGNRSS